MGLGRSKEEAPPDDAAPPAPAETPPPSGVNFTSDEEEAVQVRKAARAPPGLLGLLHCWSGQQVQLPSIHFTHLGCIGIHSLSS